MQPIGRKLKQKRESLGMTLVDLENKIKIQRKYIEMIERNDFASLPNPNYTVGFIEKYAKSVNLNAEKLIEEHQDELPDDYISAVEAKQHLNETQTIVKKDDQLIRQLIISLVGLILVISVVWLLSAKLLFKSTDNRWTAGNVNESRDVKVEAKEKSKAAAKKQEVKEKPVKPVKVVKTSVKYKSFDGSTLSYDVVTNERLVLKVKSSVPTWIQVNDDNEKRYAYQKVKDKTMTIDNKVKTVTLISGNSTDLQVWINDQKLDVPKTADSLITRTYQFAIESTD
ncbi:helix-turn-helix domain-containing protein [Macrococcus equipercicus]|uniref:Helix-turn-helix domain-containing protein n=1 Tax=Macrococcus equipercicus TaxID=69967 RepID=A0ABQ6R6S3_9STAP|nr:helix-turn-helix domain-containing protein [Macrococcus equipercicus]KAA1036986.1 helix-turn-helix domain-containing protein [Macrococcus equipercicus]